MEYEETSKETLVYLDFNDKIPAEVRDDKMFVRIVNLEDKNPLVQVNDMVFEGTYDYSVGTNLFFKQTPKQGENEFPFLQSIKYDLELFKTQTKILNCKQMKIPPTAATLPDNNEKLQYNFKWDYEELLNKFEHGTLNIKDMMTEHNEGVQETILDVSPEHNEELPGTELNWSDNIEMTEPDEVLLKNISEEPYENQPKVAHENLQMQPNEVLLMNIPEEPYENQLKVAYENLQMLARRPVKRRSIVEAVESDPNYSNLYHYRSIECKVLEPPFFSYFTKVDHQKDISNHVDLYMCERLGIIEPCSSIPRILTEEEIKKIFTMENFENLTLTGRYSVLLSHIKELEKQISSNTSEDNSRKDEFGHTPLETLQTFKKLLCSLKNQIQNVSSIK